MFQKDITKSSDHILAGKNRVTVTRASKAFAMSVSNASPAADDKDAMSQLEAELAKLKTHHQETQNQLKQFEKKQVALRSLIQRFISLKTELTQQLNDAIRECDNKKREAQIYYSKELEKLKMQIGQLQDPLNNEKMQYNLIKDRLKNTNEQWSIKKAEMSSQITEKRYQSALTRAKIIEVRNRVNALRIIMASKSKLYNGENENQK